MGYLNILRLKNGDTLTLLTIAALAGKVIISLILYPMLDVKFFKYDCE